jgi:hypothetical protein
MTDKPSAEALDAARKYLGAQPNIVVLALAEVVPALAAALDAFAAEAVARERDLCAQAAETYQRQGHWDTLRQGIATAIRARGQS